MTTCLNSGEVFVPNKQELLTILLYLKGVFAPETYSLFETDYNKRELLVESLEKPFLYMDILSEQKYYPDFDILEDNVEGMSLCQCAQYMLFYLRLAKRHGGGDNFISLWKRGIIEQLVDRMLEQYDSCMIG